MLDVPIITKAKPPPEGEYWVDGINSMVKETKFKNPYAYIFDFQDPPSRIKCMGFLLFFIYIGFRKKHRNSEGIQFS